MLTDTKKKLYILNGLSNDAKAALRSALEAEGSWERANGGEYLYEDDDILYTEKIAAHRGAISNLIDKLQAAKVLLEALYDEAFDYPPELRKLVYRANQEGVSDHSWENLQKVFSLDESTAFNLANALQSGIDPARDSYNAHR